MAAMMAATAAVVRTRSAPQRSQHIALSLTADFIKIMPAAFFGARSCWWPCAHVAVTVAVLMAALPVSCSEEAHGDTCTLTAEATSGASLLGVENCPCLVEDAANGYLAASPDLPTV